MLRHPSPLRYPGGKQSLSKLLADVIVENNLHDGTVVEPFAGGAGASLQLTFDELADKLIINDLDPHIFAFWRSVINQTQALTSKIQRCRVNMATWRACKEIYNSPVHRNCQLDVAFATFFLNRCNRSGIIMGGGPIGGYEQKGKWKLGARFNKRDLIDRIERIASYKERISVTKTDATTLLKNLAPSAGERLLVFLDPPYYNKGQRLYLNSLAHDDHVRLSESLLNNPSYYWVLTYDNTPEIRRLYKSARPRAFELSYSAYERRVGKEIMIFDPRLKVPENLLHNYNCIGKISFSRL